MAILEHDAFMSDKMINDICKEITVTDQRQIRYQ